MVVLTFAVEGLPLPSKMPETAGDVVIYICISCVVFGLTGMAIMLRWWAKHVHKLEENSIKQMMLFAEESDKAREAHEREQKAARDSHAAMIDKLNDTHQRIIDRSYASFERSIEKLTAGIENLRRPPNRQGGGVAP